MSRRTTKILAIVIIVVMAPMFLAIALAILVHPAFLLLLLVLCFAVPLYRAAVR